MKQKFVSVVATPIVTEDKLNPDDIDVWGTYSILLDADVDIVEAADVALDIFHSNVPIKILDDFGFTVLHEDEPLFSLDSWENYMGSNRGTFIGKESKFVVYEYDSVKRKKLKKVDCAADIETAREIAAEVAGQWCEDEKPLIYRLGSEPDINAHHEICLGHADFGALIEFDL